jgi:hypothetical protein
MFVIRDIQYKLLSDNEVNKFISNQILNLKEKQYNKLSRFSSLELYNHLYLIINWGIQNDIKSGEGLEYLINMCIKYSSNSEYLKQDRIIDEIVKYPDRTEENKLLCLHHYLAYGYKL